jgi:hypothetical protein
VEGYLLLLNHKKLTLELVLAGLKLCGSSGLLSGLASLLLLHPL